MREALFVKQNTQKWKKFEDVPTSDPDELAERFITITDDLSYAKTFYPESKTTLYLNGLAAGFHQSIYKNKKGKTNRIIYFWQYELPLLFKKYRRQLLYSFVFFWTFFFIGLISAKYDDNFVRYFLGDDYVNMTNENIAKGDPFAVFKHENEFVMFFMIAKNNIYVTFLNFVLGIACSVGTVFILFKNGLMVGTFQYLFIKKGLGLQSLLVIWIHGTLEISSIIIAGGAGLVLGNSILFPGTYTRFASFKRGVLDGLKITVGLVPIVLTAAFLESFVTRHTEMPAPMSITILLCSFLFIAWYVIIYPQYLSNKLNTTKSQYGETKS
jgi:uncharacterized membrane protein SpoIIM required for sporulation